MGKQRAMTVVPFTKPPDWKSYAVKIGQAWQKGVEGILETGRLLLDAKSGPNKLPHGSFEAMVKLQLPFTPRTARMLMVIANHPILSKRNHGSVLPPSWRTLYELANVPEPKLIRALADGTITPKLERKDVRELCGGAVKPRPRKGKSTKEVLQELHGPATYCLFQVRDIVIDALGAIPKIECAELFAALREQLDKLEKDHG